MKATVYIDGSGNSDRIQACACVLYREDGCWIESTRLLPHRTTNNVGEYNGALLAVQTAIDHGVTNLQILSDSKLIVYQLQGKWDCKNPALIKLRDQVREVAQALEEVDIRWIPREENTHADRLCREAIKNQTSGEEVFRISTPSEAAMDLARKRFGV